MNSYRRYNRKTKRDIRNLANLAAAEINAALLNQDLTLGTGDFSANDGTFAGDVTVSGSLIGVDHSDLDSRDAADSHPATAISVVAAGFSGMLGAGDTDVQTALSTIDTTLTAVEWAQLANIGAATISSAQWAWLGADDQALTTGSSPQFVDGHFSNSIILGGSAVIELGGVNEVRIATGDNFTVVDGVLESGGVLRKSAGSAGSPSGSFTASPGTGDYLIASNQYGIATDSGLRMVIDSTGVEMMQKAKVTAIGGSAILVTNKTGANSVKGQVVKASTAHDFAVQLSGASEQECIGVFLDSGVADGSEAWVVVSGWADVALKDNTAGTHGYWLFASSEAGYGDATLAAPPGGGIPELDQHMQELGHCFETKAATGGGTHILVRCHLHLN